MKRRDVIVGAAAGNIWCTMGWADAKEDACNG